MRRISLEKDKRKKNVEDELGGKVSEMLRSWEASGRLLQGSGVLFVTLRKPNLPQL